jgi:hypothetical protein
LCISSERCDSSLSHPRPSAWAQFVNYNVSIRNCDHFSKINF